jgi:hypothetical protein
MKQENIDVLREVLHLILKDEEQRRLQQHFEEDTPKDIQVTINLEVISSVAEDMVCTAREISENWRKERRYGIVHHGIIILDRAK